MKILRVFIFLLAGGVANAQTSQTPVTSPVDGNSIPEPELKDYQVANRSPGILVEPYDIVDHDGVPEGTPGSL